VIAPLLAINYNYFEQIFKINYEVLTEFFPVHRNYGKQVVAWWWFHEVK